MNFDQIADLDFQQRDLAAKRKFIEITTALVSLLQGTFQTTADVLKRKTVQETLNLTVDSDAPLDQVETILIKRKTFGEKKPWLTLISTSITIEQTLNRF